MRKARLSTAECALSVGRFLEMAIGIEDKDIQSKTLNTNPGPVDNLAYRIACLRGEKYKCNKDKQQWYKKFKQRWYKKFTPRALG